MSTRSTSPTPATKNATGISVIETPPAKTTFAPANSTPGWNDIGGGQFQYDIGNLDVGTMQSINFAIEIDNNFPSNIRTTVNIATANDDGTNGVDPNPADNTANESTTLRIASRPIIAVGADAGGGPHVRVFDPATGNETLNFFAYNPTFTGGVRVATGDVNGDGLMDIITGAGLGGGPHVKVFDGQTGAEIRSFFAFNRGFSGGVYVGAGDVNGDGFADIITGSGAGGGPHVRVFDGNGGGILHDFFAYDTGFAGGVRVAGGDVNNDGFDDIITGVGPGGGPHVRVLSGQTGAELQSFFAYAPTFSDGIFVASGDTNNDGFHEVVVSGEQPAPLNIFDGQTNALLSAFDPLVNIDRFSLNELAGQSTVRVAAVDIVDDGGAEILTSTGTGLPPEVRTFAADTQQELDRFFAFDQEFTNGVFVGNG